MMELKDFIKEKSSCNRAYRIKGSWLCKYYYIWELMLQDMLLNQVQNQHYLICINLSKKITSYIGDIRDLAFFQEVFEKENLKLFFIQQLNQLYQNHTKIQFIHTKQNVMGTVNLLECVRLSDTVKSVVNVTTDKVYENKEWEWGYREEDVLDGFDPYSNSKSCSELVTHSYIRSFFVGQ